MEGHDDVRVEDAVVDRTELLDNDESFKREEIRFGIARHRTDSLDRPSVGEICVHGRMVAAEGASQPLVYRGDQHRCVTADGELVVPGGNRAVAFEAIDPALDRMPLLVVVLVETGRAATVGAELSTVANLVRLLRYGALHATSPQVGAVRAGAVRLVRPDPVRLRARAAGPGPRHADGVQDRLELRAVVSLAGGDEQGQRLLPLLDRQVQLRGQPTARAAEAVVIGLGVDGSRRLLLEIPFLRAPEACW